MNQTWEEEFDKMVTKTKPYNLTPLQVKYFIRSREQAIRAEYEGKEEVRNQCSHCKHHRRMHEDNICHGKQPDDYNGCPCGKYREQLSALTPVGEIIKQQARTEALENCRKNLEEAMPNILHKFNRELNYTEAYSDAGPLERKGLKEKYTKMVIASLSKTNN